MSTANTEADERFSLIASCYLTAAKLLGFAVLIMYGSEDLYGSRTPLLKDESVFRASWIGILSGLVVVTLLDSMSSTGARPGWLHTSAVAWLNGAPSKLTAGGRGPDRMAILHVALASAITEVFYRGAIVAVMPPHVDKFLPLALGYILSIPAYGHFKGSGVSDEEYAFACVVGTAMACAGAYGGIAAAIVAQFVSTFGTHALYWHARKRHTVEAQASKAASKAAAKEQRPKKGKRK